MNTAHRHYPDYEKTRSLRRHLLCSRSDNTFTLLLCWLLVTGTHPSIPLNSISLVSHGCLCSWRVFWKSAPTTRRSGHPCPGSGILEEPSDMVTKVELLLATEILRFSFGVLFLMYKLIYECLQLCGRST